MTEVFQSPCFLYLLYVTMLQHQDFLIPRTCSLGLETYKPWQQLLLVPLS